MTTDIQRAIDIISRFGHLRAEEAEDVMNQIMRGEATEAQVGAYLMGLRMKGETHEEILGSARAMRANAIKVPVRDGADLLDTCGTGGDKSGTFNISTTVAFVAAGAGVRIAKHGNRASTSKCGSADVLAELGVTLDLTPEQVGQCVDTIGIGFLFAPRLHPAMKHAIGPRRQMAVRTIFNILGPLTNPAGAQRQLMGVFAPDLTDFIATVLGDLGSTAAIVVCGYGNLDELTTTGPNRVSHYANGTVRSYDLDPGDLGLSRAHIADLQGGDAPENARILRGILGGTIDSSKRDVVLLNAGAALVAAGVADDIPAGITLAAQSIDSGAALAKLDALIATSQELAAHAVCEYVRTDTVLDKILAHKVEEIAAREAERTLADVRQAAEQAAPARGMIAALRRDTVALIAEVKHASPSRGVLIEPFDPVALGTVYAQNGAAAISVLTDEAFFQGSLDHLAAVRAAVDVPVLREDFVIAPYQVYEARAAGADAVLLIAAALDDTQLADLGALVAGLGMAALVEVHNQSELARVLRMNPALVGINNRDLKTFAVDIATTRALAAQLPPEITLVAESGIFSGEDVRRMGQAGARAVLVGEALVTAPDTGAKVRELSRQPFERE